MRNCCRVFFSRFFFLFSFSFSSFHFFRLILSFLFSMVDDDDDEIKKKFDIQYTSNAWSQFIRSQSFQFFQFLQLFHSFYRFHLFPISLLIFFVHVFSAFSLQRYSTFLQTSHNIRFVWERVFDLTQLVIWTTKQFHQYWPFVNNY